MQRLLSVFFIIFLTVLGSCSNPNIENISPNQFEGSDIERIQLAIDAAEGTTNKIFIPSRNSNGTNKWLLDIAILLPSNMTVVLDNCIIQLSDKCRDNMFRSNNVGIGISDPNWNHNISLIGIGDVVLKGADNPRATGDGGKTLILNSDDERENWRVSYGSDTGKKERKQKGDWRNIMILMAYLDGFVMKNIKIENTHAWAVSFERTLNADVSDIDINNPEEIMVNGESVLVRNRDGIDLRQGCKNFRIDHISGKTGDDFIALSNLDTRKTDYNNCGTLKSTMVTMEGWGGPEDDIEQIFISNINCQSKFRGIAIRTSDSASIHHVYIDGLITRKWHGGSHNSVLVGGKGYGKPSLPGRINNIHAMNIVGNGYSLIHIEAPIANCSFMNGIYNGQSGQYNGDGKPITYNLDKNTRPNQISNIDKDKVRNVVLKNMISIEGY